MNHPLHMEAGIGELPGSLIKQPHQRSPYSYAGYIRLKIISMDKPESLCLAKEAWITTDITPQTLTPVQHPRPSVAVLATWPSEDIYSILGVMGSAQRSGPRGTRCRHSKAGELKSMRRQTRSASLMERQLVATCLPAWGVP